MLKKLFNTGQYQSSVNLALLLFRAGLGIMMLTHGFPKFQRLMAGEFRFGDPLGLGVEASLILTVLAEFVGSILLILGLATRLALIPMMVTMIVAWGVVHVDDPFGTQEKAALYLLCFVVMFITGPGKYSADDRLLN